MPATNEKSATLLVSINLHNVQTKIVLGALTHLNLANTLPLLSLTNKLPKLFPQLHDPPPNAFRRIVRET